MSDDVVGKNRDGLEKPSLTLGDPIHHLGRTEGWVS